jgi:hypothetical protein
MADNDIAAKTSYGAKMASPLISRWGKERYYHLYQDGENYGMPFM